MMKSKAYQDFFAQPYSRLVGIKSADLTLPLAAIRGFWMVPLTSIIQMCLFGDYQTFIHHIIGVG